MEENKYKKLFNFLASWVSLNELGITVGNYLKKREITKVAIYGMGVLGRHLLFELKEAGISVIYAVDKRSDNLNIDVSFVDLKNKEILPNIDMLIVTAIADYSKIEKEICELGEYPVISLEDIIKNMKL